jgi:hypothetical protein
MNATELKKDIKDIEGAIASPVTPDFIKEKMKSKLVELKDKLKDLETPAPTKKATPDKKEKSDKIKLKEIIILWAEGDQSKYPTFPAKYKTWESANNGVKPMLEKEIGGYNKVKFEVHWEDGDTYEGRLDVSEREDNPYATSNVFGKHIYDYITYLINDGKLTDQEKQEYQDFLQKYDLGLISSVKSPAKKPAPTPDKKTNGLDENFKKWYVKTYPNDELGEKLKESPTFSDIYNGLKKGEDIYSFFGFADSIVRERSFQRLAEILGKKYEYVYNLWLGRENESKPTLAPTINRSSTPAPAPAPKKKSVPVKKEDMPAEEEYDCDDLIEKAKERRKKARERAKLPKKQEVTKNIEKIDKVIQNIEKRAEKDNVSVSELEKLIIETEELLTVLKVRMKYLK